MSNLVTKLYDWDWNGYALFKNGLFVLCLRDVPEDGKQIRQSGRWNDGVLSDFTLRWFRIYHRWQISYFPLICEDFQIKMLRISAKDGNGVQHHGFVDVRILKGRPVCPRYGVFERQVEILISDLQKSLEEARRIGDRYEKE